ncbi:MAG: VOC family protein [Paracoccaceae bacterium]
MVELDHLTVIAPSLDEGLAYLTDRLGFEIGDAARHPAMGTQNRRLRLGSLTYLEVIAIDPEAPRPTHPRWFGLGAAETVRRDWEAGRRLRAWVARTEAIGEVLAAHGDLLGTARRLPGPLDFALLADGRLPADGALPSIIDRLGKPPPSIAMTDRGARLARFCLEHPEPAALQALYERIGIRGAPEILAGPVVRLRATLETPAGPVELT